MFAVCFVGMFRQCDVCMGRDIWAKACDNICLIHMESRIPAWAGSGRPAGEMVDWRRYNELGVFGRWCFVQCCDMFVRAV